MTAVNNRMLASASFVGVLIIIGLPLWWKTTEVYRVALPYDKISSFDSLPHTITSEVVVLAKDETTAAQIAGLIEKGFEKYDFLNIKVVTIVQPPSLHQELDSLADEEEAYEEVASCFDIASKIFVVQRLPLFQDVWVGRERVVFFRNVLAAPVLAEVLQKWIFQTAELAGAKSDVADEARRTRFPPADAYHIVLSVINPRPDKITVNFNAEEALEDYIGSFVDELRDLHNFTLKSQWLYQLDFDFQSKEVADQSEWARHFPVSRARLAQLTSRLEERAAPHSGAPCLQLLYYQLLCDKAPVRISQLHGDTITHSVQAFMSPKWGGVYLHNPTPTECANEMVESAPTVRLVMGTYLAQLRKLLGFVDTEPIKGAYMDPLRSVIPRRWEIDALLRLRTLEQITSAERTLQSLAQLLGEISNIVINDDVAASINLAVDSIHRATSLMKQGKLLEAYRSSQVAYRAAETAFMEPSLLALLYFPDDQKYAIYIPLFLPVMFPVLLSLKNLLLWLRGKPIKEKAD